MMKMFDDRSGVKRESVKKQNKKKIKFINVEKEKQSIIKFNMTGH